MLSVKTAPSAKTFTRDEALRASLVYFNGDKFAADVFVNKYALLDKDNKYLEDTPEAMHWRMAKEFARIEQKYPFPMSEQEIFELFHRFKYVVPQGSPMSAVGNFQYLQSASNCFTIASPSDTYSGILRADQEQAQIMKRRGGVGFDISHIRPRGQPTSNAARTTDGISVFMERFSNTCREVAQGGRRGALMLTISCHHPEIMTFINIKRDLKKVTGANISIRWTDEFMEAVKAEQQVELRWPVDSTEPKIRSKVNAKEVWDAFVDSAWASAEPGALFWDSAQRLTPSDIYKDFGFGSISTNPCGEIILSAYDSCRLMCINLFSFVKDPYTKDAQFDYAKYGEVVQKAQRLMDDLVDIEIEAVDRIIAKVESDPESMEDKAVELNLWRKIRDAAQNGRRTGLGITALGDTLAAMGIRYGDKPSIAFTERVYKDLAVNSYRSSVSLAKERGTFPVFSHKLEDGHPFLQRIWDEDPELYKQYVAFGRRNIANTTTAPTGSVSTLTQTTSGIEPAAFIHYCRRRKVNPSDKNARVDFVDPMGDSWEEYTMTHKGFLDWAALNGHTWDPNKAREYAKDTDIPYFDESPYAGATCNDVDWGASVEIQAAAQKWVCHAISKTCNLPKTATKELVSHVYMRAWELGCKGFTVYRDGSRTGVLIQSDTKDAKSNDWKKRPHAVPCDVFPRILVRGSPFFVIVGKHQDMPYEVFAGTGALDSKSSFGKVLKHKRGHYEFIADDGSRVDNVCDLVTDDCAAITRLMSLSLRHGVDIKYIVQQLEKTPGDLNSFGRAISRVIKKYIPNGEKENGATCPHCGNDAVTRQEGCISCPCGWSKCS